MDLILINLFIFQKKCLELRKKKKVIKITDISILFDKSTLSDKEAFLNREKCDIDYSNEIKNDLDYRDISLFEIREKGVKKCQLLKSKCEILVKNINEIIGYYTLYRIGGISGLDPDYKINRIGIYFSRHAYLHLFNVDDIINEKRFPDFIKWFMQKAVEIFKTEDIKKELEEGY